MISKIEKHQRILVILGLFLLFLVGGAIMMSLDLAISGSLFFIGIFGMVIYLPVIWFLKKKNNLPLHSSWMNQEMLGAATFVALVCLAGALESFPEYPELTIVYTLLMILAGLFIYLKPSAHYRKFPYWILGIGIGIILISLNDLFDEELFIITVLVYFAVLFILVIRWLFRQIQFIIQLKNEQAKAELLQLKSQVSPHFFFNMLNNLYGLVAIDAKKAQDLILKLSDLMRYSIYEGQKDQVTLEEEVDYLKQYIDLHKMRYHKKISVKFDVDLQEEGYQVMPLLFIILLENAFKHGVENLRENAFVNVNMAANGKEIHFSVENNFDSTEPTEQAGIGLKNLKRRLELVYPKQHTLSFFVEKDVYKVHLMLKQL